MWLVKVQYYAYKAPRWVLGSDECPGFVKAIQKSRKTATQFKTREEAEAVAATLNTYRRTVEVVPCY